MRRVENQLVFCYGSVEDKRSANRLDSKDADELGHDLQVASRLDGRSEISYWASAVYLH